MWTSSATATERSRYKRWRRMHANELNVPQVVNLRQVSPIFNRRAGCHPAPHRTLIAALCTVMLASAAGDARLSQAAMQGNKEAVRGLLKQRVDVDGAQGDGTTALHWAAFKDDLEMV